MISEDARLAVKKGAYWMDENYPGWAQLIELDNLEMDACENCIIGQAIDGYYTDVTLKAIGTNHEEASSEQYRMAVSWAREHGFDVGLFDGRFQWADIADKYHELETLWTDQVKERLGEL